MKNALSQKLPRLTYGVQSRNVTVFRCSARSGEKSAGEITPALRLELGQDFERLSNASVDQRNQGVDRLRGDGAGTSVEVEAGHLVLGRHYALQDRYETLQVEELVECRGDIA